MILKIGILMVATFFMFSNWVSNIDGNYDRLIAYLLFLIIILLTAGKENK